MVNILIGSPVRQTVPVLREFLRSLEGLDFTGISPTFCFVDDNPERESSSLLTGFASDKRCTILDGHRAVSGYQRAETTHAWPGEAVSRVAAYKDAIIAQAIADGCDGLFFVDSDLVLHPRTLQQLLRTQKEIVSEIFWTRWAPDQPELPQVWMSDQYRLTQQFVDQLRWSGVFPVGGLGACTLLRRRALEMGISFRQIPNLSLTGEDRHFCIRAAALGLDLHVDTHLPAYHIYRDQDLGGVSGYRAQYGRMASQIDICQAIHETLEAWGSGDWRTMTGLEGLDGFTSDLREQELKGRETKLREAKANRSVSRTEITAVKVTALNEEDGLSSAVAGIVNEGVERESPYRDEFVAEVSLTRRNGGWLIANVNFSPL